MDAEEGDNTPDNRERRDSGGEQRISKVINIITTTQGILTTLTLIDKLTEHTTPAAITAAGIVLSATGTALKAWQLRQR